MLPGKVPPDILKNIVFPFLGSHDPDVILGPQLGQDASLIRVGNHVIVASTDPITGSVEDIGWLAVNVNANDIATFGVQPRWFLVSILLPPGCSKGELERIAHQIHEAAAELRISVVGGHTEITEGLDRPIIAGFMMGVCENGEYVTSSGARAGDAVILTKTVGIEGTAILAAEGEAYLRPLVGDKVISEARELRKHISVVRDGVTAFSTGHVTAMHDPTEGGLAGGIHELCDASRVGVEISMGQIPVHPATAEICRALDVDVLSLISSGCMVMTCRQGHEEDVVTALRSAEVPAVVVGRVLEQYDERVIIEGDKKKPLERPTTDALWAALARVTARETP
ncbi:MAG: AIR synthase family protein [Candidatus Thorarchaeota archaeon]